MVIDKKHLNIIKECPLFAGKNEREIFETLDILGAKYKEFGKGETILRSEEKFNRFGLLLFGTANACTVDIDGNEMIMADINPGNTFGESICYLKLANSPVYVTATENCGVLMLCPDCLFENSENRRITDIKNRFMTMLAKRTLAMNVRIQVLSKIKLRDKILTYLSYLSNQNGGGAFSIPFNREDFATYIGSDRASLSRELSKLKSEGKIDFYKNTFKLLK
ncbi:MAG: Crp/Fnr family transcriptional regulator [Clostridia bacterium]|nr:Crp/Fnr family transcriptional regulator [Clostridia bacterium]